MTLFHSIALLLAILLLPFKAFAINTPVLTISNSAAGVTISDTRAGHTAALRNISLTGVLSGGTVSVSTISSTNGTVTNLTVTSLTIVGGGGSSAVAASGSVQSDGTLISGFNIASSVRNSAGTYTITFSNAMANATYHVAGALNQDSSCTYTFGSFNKSTNSFQVHVMGTCDSGHGFADIGYDFIVAP